MEGNVNYNHLKIYFVIKAQLVGIIYNKYKLQTSSRGSENLLIAALQISNSAVRFVVLTAESLKTQAFWDMTLLCFITLRTDDLYLFLNGGGAAFLSFFLNNFDQVCNLTTYTLAVNFLPIHSASSSTHCCIPGMNHYRLRYLSQIMYSPLQQLSVSLHAQHIQLPVTFTLAEHTCTNNRNV